MYPLSLILDLQYSSNTEQLRETRMSSPLPDRTQEPRYWPQPFKLPTSFILGQSITSWAPYVLLGKSGATQYILWDSYKIMIINSHASRKNITQHMRHIQVPPSNSLRRCHEHAYRDRFIASSEQACSFSVRSKARQGSAVPLGHWCSEWRGQGTLLSTGHRSQMEEKGVAENLA